MSRREPLNRAKVVATALALADEEGIEALTMRRLAKALGVEAMSLYNHVANKTDLLDALAELVFASVERADPALPWTDRLRLTARNLYREFSRHPVVSKAVVSDQANPTSEAALRPTEDVLEALFEAGFDEKAARQALIAVNGLVFGTLALATSGYSTPPRPAAGGLDAFHRVVNPAWLPHFARLLAIIPDSDPTEDFDHALELLITGLVAAAPNSG
ncbi:MULTISPECIES: TetR/AcrR family transcriptional regulator C-terminal domain-containing protein [Streptomyces]|uniref:Transcriptional regulator, TetR family n=1 Tax=Streptomyces griseoaurantiacus TaxID=68213 RepID=A0A1G7TAA3_9ACTN|nr:MULTISPECIES: TetR/AcrR family transcriptional regulator C-terminal domain-containing protein [Streptomyces]MCF0087841.1 Tetracycline repressor protein class H [Streptomyces sp. MH192]MCF0097615.1 Tetracycline repressor protein class H [Streptomyces sp. MH191]NJP75062.1 TetR family transcriptional regulator [Streptomyces sp. C1-2]WTI30075.1 TetR/AcrR family transcriptional regulator C-terminal domain-containing protein [Streptomyces jietaisiensis]SDG32253.1 transcriptional regulator, TetR f